MRGPLPADLIDFAALQARRNQYGGLSKEPILHVMKKKPVLKLMNTVQYGSGFRDIWIFLFGLDKFIPLKLLVFLS